MTTARVDKLAQELIEAELTAANERFPLFRSPLEGYAVLLEESGIVNQSRYRTKTIPAAGALLKEEDMAEKQQSFDV